MFQVYSFGKLILVSMFVLIAGTAFATDDPERVSVFKGYQGEIVKNAFRETFDDLFYPSQSNTLLAPANDKITNAVSLIINEAALDKIQSDFTARVKIKIEYTNKDGHD